MYMNMHMNVCVWICVHVHIYIYACMYVRVHALVTEYEILRFHCFYNCTVNGLVLSKVRITTNSSISWF